MSQTETLLLFVLGFCVALFVVLLFGRGVFALVGSWSGWRENRKVPAAIRELQAERDSLRAEKAMMAQKLEASINDMKMRMAEQMAEVSRNRNRVLDMTQTLKEREATIGHLQSQLDDKVSQGSSLENQIEENVKSINLAYAKMAQREDEHVKMQQVLKEAQATLLMRDEKIRNLMDETKALRDLVGGQPSQQTDPVAFHDKPELRVQPPAMELPAPLAGTNSFETRFARIASGNPLTHPHVVDLQSENGQVHASDNQDEVDRGVSNVLSLAERVRGLQTGMKKA